MSVVPEVIDVAGLLVALPGSSPCGPDLEYDHEFMTLFQFAEGKPERQLGDNLVPSEEPDWAEVRRRATSLFGRTKDLRVAMLLTRALTRTANLEGLRAGLALIRELVAAYWEEMHPCLDPSDGHDPTMRLNVLAPLADPGTLLRDVRYAYVVRPGSLGHISVRDILGAVGKLPPTAGATSLAELEGILTKVAAQDDALVLRAPERALTAASELQSLLSEKFGGNMATDLAPLIDSLKVVVQVCAQILGTAVPECPAEAPGAPAAEPARTALRGEIHSRDEAVRMLGLICAFIERTEPTNPAPLMIRRAQRLMTKSFVEIIEDLAPDSLGQIQKLFGQERE